MTKQKTIEQKYRKLSEVEHVLLRPGRYIGAITPHSESSYVYDSVTKKMNKQDVTYNPGFIKLFDEVISNAVDHSKRPEGKMLDTIKVEVDQVKGEISIFDNGGIPVLKHSEYDQWVPEMIFELRAGSNFDDEDEAMLTGQNGEGAALTNIFSTRFVVETCDTKNSFKMIFTENSTVRGAAQVKPAGTIKPHTKITYSPDFDKLGCKFTDDNLLMLQKRVVDVAGLNPRLKVYWNGERIPTKTFKDYVEMYTDEYAYDETENWKVAVAASDDGFQQVSFVNGTNTKLGGTHVAYAGNQIWERIREHIKKKHKIDVKPSELRQHMILFIDCSIVNPRYSSQTKEDLQTESRDYKTSWEVPDVMIRKIVKSNIIQSILDWAAAKALQNEMQAMRKANKTSEKANLKNIKKFHDATDKDRSKTMVFLAEGDSASASVLGARDPRFHASFPLRGRPINVSGNTFAKIKENAEFEAIRTIVGLQYGQPADLENLNFGKIVITSDADEFGNSIAGLIINMFYRLWPEIVEAGLLYRLVTPMVIVDYKKTHLEFFTEDDFEVWRKSHANEKYDYTFLKGLGSSTPAQFKGYLSNLDKYLVRFTFDKKLDEPVLNLCFEKTDGAADKRKVWLDIE
jgi:DNA topoisomerase-2